MSTPHISAPVGAFAKTVLMAGDPLRAKFVAQNHLMDARLVNDVRNMYGYTGTYKGCAVSVMGSGMGMPSIGIYSYELFRFYDVENIIRIGSTGSYREELKLMDVVMASKSYSDSTYALLQSGCQDKIMLPSAKLNKIIHDTATRMGIPLHEAAVHSSDVFYTQDSMEDYLQLRERTATDCVEMESFALFHNANVLHKNAATLLTISDSFCQRTQISAQARQNAFSDMITLALESAIQFTPL